jgi:hypothetical protein
MLLTDRKQRKRMILTDKRGNLAVIRDKIWYFTANDSILRLNEKRITKYRILTLENRMYQEKLDPILLSEITFWLLTFTMKILFVPTYACIITNIAERYAWVLSINTFVTNIVELSH